MGCNCTKIKDLPTCLSELLIGTIGLISQSVFVFITNTSNGQSTRVNGVSDAEGLVTIDLSILPNNFFSPNYTYEIHITDTDAGPSSKELIIMGYTESDCLSVRFFRVEDDTLEAVYYLTIEAELA